MASVKGLNFSYFLNVFSLICKYILGVIVGEAVLVAVNQSKCRLNMLYNWTTFWANNRPKEALYKAKKNLKDPV